MSKWGWIGLAIAVFAALLVLAAPWIGTVAAITVIGLPIAIIYWAIPAVVMAGVLTVIIARLLPYNFKAAVVPAFVLALVVLAVLPFLLNLKLGTQASRLVAGDRNELNLPLRPKTIALRQQWFPINRNDVKRGYSQCNQFCIHALLNRVAEKVLIVQTKNPFSAIQDDEPAIEYSLRKQAQCPAVKFKGGYKDLYFGKHGGKTFDQPDWAGEIMLQIASGTCLVSRETTLGEADVVLTRAPAKKRGRSPFGSHFNLSADTLSASRYSVHRREADTDTFREVFRETAVSYYVFGPLLIPVPHMAAELRTNMGWWRNKKQINPRKSYPRHQAWTRFLTHTLGFNLALKVTDPQERTVKTIQSVLNAQRGPTPAEWRLIANHYERTGIGSRHAVSNETTGATLRLLASPELPVPPRLHAVVRRLVKAGATDDLKQLVAALMQRLSAGQTWADELEEPMGKQIREISTAIRHVPAQYLLAHEADMLAAAKRPQVQLHGLSLMRRLSVYGERAVPMQLDLIRTGLAEGKRYFRKRQYQHAYLGGLGGICISAEKAIAARPELLRLARAGELPFHGPYGRLLWTTFLRLGVDAQEVWNLYEANTTKPKEKWFQRMSQRAMKGTRGCGF